MKIFTASLFSVMLLANSAMAFSLPSTASLDPKEAKLKVCMLQEAEQNLAAGTLTKDNIDAQAVTLKKERLRIKIFLFLTEIKKLQRNY